MVKFRKIKSEIFWFAKLGSIFTLVCLLLAGCVSSQSVPDRRDNTPSNVTTSDDDRLEDIVENTLELEDGSTVPMISAERLWGAYDSNESATDAEWKGKIIVVTGVVDASGEDSTIENGEYITLDNDFVTLKTGEQFRPLQCIFPESEGILAKVSSGEEVMILGEVDGIGFASCLYIRECSLIEE